MAGARKKSTSMSGDIEISLVKIPERQERAIAGDSVIDLLESYGLIETSRALAELGKWPPAKIESVSADIFDFLLQQRHTWKVGREEISPFVSFASASMRGDSSCWEPECKAAKLRVLERYAAMYADYVYVMLPLAEPTAHKADGAAERFRQTVLTLLELRPLVEGGRIRPLAPVAHYCEECASRALDKFKEGTQTVKHQVAERLRDFQFSYSRPSSELPLYLVQARGPSRYLEHGSRFSIYPERPSWLPKLAEAGKVHKLRRNTAAHANLVGSIFRDIAFDVLFHNQSALTSDAAYLTDLPGEVEFLGLLASDDELAIRTAAICSQLTHEIPMLTHVPVRTILRIREENPQSFELYRSAIRKIVRDHIRPDRSTTAQEAREIYLDVLAPALEQLRVDAKREHSKWARKSVATAALALGVVSLGATGVLQSQQVLSLLGGAVIKGLADQLAESGTEPVKANNLYFLLRLEEEGKKRR